MQFRAEIKCMWDHTSLKNPSPFHREERFTTNWAENQFYEQITVTVIIVATILGWAFFTLFPSCWVNRKKVQPTLLISPKEFKRVKRRHNIYCWKIHQRNNNYVKTFTRSKINSVTSIILSTNNKNSSHKQWQLLMQSVFFCRCSYYYYIAKVILRLQWLKQWVNVTCILYLHKLLLLVYLSKWRFQLHI